MTAATAEHDLEHLPELATLATIIVGFIVCMNLLHGSDTLAYLIAIGILCSRDEWSPR